MIRFYKQYPVLTIVNNNQQKGAYLFSNNKNKYYEISHW